MQLGFVIDHSRCIGCHACTVACKSENDVPVGNFRTWVKYTEQGTFPQVKRSFAVLRCNQCSHPPCVTICPVNALSKGASGIVDIDPAACVGCKSCMQACPYDALYLNEDTGLAEKCHFCAHRTEVGLAPACAVVCPTEAIIPGDFDDPTSRVSRLRAAGGLVGRKPEAGTRPNVLYREADKAGLDPALTNSAGGYLWANQQPGVQLDAQVFEALENKAQARTTYDVNHPPMWGWKVSAYLFTKSIAGGAWLVCASWAILPYLCFLERPLLVTPGLVAWSAWSALGFLLVTLGLLVTDLKRPARFVFLLLRPNWDSWLVRGGLILAAYGALLVGVLLVCGSQQILDPIDEVFYFTSAAMAGLAACYTAWLFGQARGRVLWLQRLLAARLLVQAVLAGCAWLCIGLSLLPSAGGAGDTLRVVCALALALHLAFMLGEHKLAPGAREAEFARVVRLITHGPFARRHWVHGVALGVALPLAGLAVPDVPLALVGVLALWGLWNEEDILVRAGQALPIS